jgi:four helix bundle protein
VVAENINSYKDLKVWTLAMSVAELAYKATLHFPKDEIFGMSAQIRRAATSIAANIAEGHRRETRGAFVQFLRVSQGSLKELETLARLAKRVSLGNADELTRMVSKCDELGKMLRSLIRSLQRETQQ